ncbi:hypothetical protein JGZ30_05005 [Staphylococcus pseudintermedius]|uniref:Uncharacterized protein n=2 Tax=root TaxID=1 RepID=A0A1J0MFL3_9CAUD|nr:hypothetical protein [Staphylococcus pseudintermedius]YP_010081933.1 hypothetical protein KMD13_gp34 [Staphylococcus phage SpT152]APD19849.1 hypothetical protein SpT152_034 [Staphylococcus phage SpT152]EGQ0295493.1 hypothetical protein [Staphylococcus pseudintermedius]EGQ0366575.1 hypothetical protein [Staphylococcus pseudintermedius]EGQ2672976.1 hypothetical protein [Staphylococcus pseudintermedius]EGQ2757200.1 hypothetical protein [Staphylococcus pseudintermedius]
MEHDSKEYYENQSEYWFNEASKFVKQRDILIDDNAKLRKERAKLQRKLDDVVSMVNAYITAERAYSGESAYNLLENELNRILEDE